MILFKRALLATCVCLALGEYSHASIATFDILDRGGFVGLVDSNTSATYSGTGFLGVSRIPVSSRFNVDLVGHFFGLSIDQATPIGSVIQVDISSLAGKTISNATLSFDLRHGLNDDSMVSVTSFETNGLLGFAWDPTPLGQTSAPVNGFVRNQIDVTELLQNRINGGASSLGLFLKANSGVLLTITDPLFRMNPDSANVDLVVEYSDAVDVLHHNPEPSTLAIWSILGVAMVVVGRRRMRG